MFFFAIERERERERVYTCLSHICLKYTTDKGPPSLSLSLSLFLFFSFRFFCASRAIATPHHLHSTALIDTLNWLTD